MSDKDKIKRRLEKEGLWVQSNIDGEDEHLMVGRTDHPGEKIHIIVDGGTGEARIEVNEKNQQPHGLIEKIETVLTMKSGEKIRTTRAKMEFFEEIPDQSSIPIIDAEIDGGTGGHSGHFVYFNIVNVSNEIAMDCKWQIRGFDYKWIPTDRSFTLRPGDKKHVAYRIDLQKPHTKEVNELNLVMEYMSNKGKKYFTRRELSQEMTKGGVWYQLNLGDFHPAEQQIDYGIKAVSVPLLDGHKYKSEFEIKYNGEQKIVSIGISTTLLAVWGFTENESVQNAMQELGTRKIRKMLIKGILEDYIFLSDNFPLSFQNGYEGYKKLRDSI